MPHTLPALPFALEALEPYMSARTLELHHGKHHQAYVNNLNLLIEGTPLQDLGLEEVIHKSFGDPARVGVFNNAAQVWNHTFFWNSLSPQTVASRGAEPAEPAEGPLKAKIVASFGSVAAFKEKFQQAATTQFGSGWAWLVQNPAGDLEILKTGNADLPMVHGYKALLACDVWEHAYYVDYQNRRPDYVKTFLDHLANWAFAEQMMGA